MVCPVARTPDPDVSRFPEGEARDAGERCPKKKRARHTHTFSRLVPTRHSRRIFHKSSKSVAAASTPSLRHRLCMCIDTVHLTSVARRLTGVRGEKIKHIHVHVLRIYGGRRGDVKRNGSSYLYVRVCVCTRTCLCAPL